MSYSHEVLKELTAILTYDGLFQSVSLINYPALKQSILESPNFTEVCFIDEHSSMWSIQDWINECKRKQHQDNVEKNFNAARAAQLEASKPKCKKDYLPLIQAALEKMDIELAMKLKEQMEKHT